MFASVPEFDMSCYKFSLVVEMNNVNLEIKKPPKFKKKNGGSSSANTKYIGAGVPRILGGLWVLKKPVVFFKKTL